MEITVHFLVVFGIKRDVTIIINFENIADENALFGKVKRR